MNKELELTKLKTNCENCSKCELSKLRTNLVFGKGNINAEILFIGEAPGENEDLEGIPFVGRAGKQLDKLLNKINLGIDDVYIANILKCRPPKNRDPNPQEIENCTPFLIEQIKIINPKIIVTLGNYATKFALNGFRTKNMQKISGISQLHGKVKKINFRNGKSFIIVPIYHPAAMLYRPQLKEILEEDFKIIEKIITKKEN